MKVRFMVCKYIKAVRHLNLLETAICKCDTSKVQKVNIFELVVDKLGQNEMKRKITKNCISVDWGKINIYYLLKFNLLQQLWHQKNILEAINAECPKSK